MYGVEEGGGGLCFNSLCLDTVQYNHDNISAWGPRDHVLNIITFSSFSQALQIMTIGYSNSSWGATKDMPKIT